MSEINEKDLEQVTGGASLNMKEWLNKNCGVCELGGNCNPDVKYVAQKNARRAAEEGTEYICPRARHYYSHNQ